MHGSPSFCQLVSLVVVVYVIFRDGAVNNGLLLLSLAALLAQVAGDLLNLIVIRAGSPKGVYHLVLQVLFSELFVVVSLVVCYLPVCVYDPLAVAHDLRVTGSNFEDVH